MNELNCFELAEGVAEDTMGLPMVVHFQNIGKTRYKLWLSDSMENTRSATFAVLTTEKSNIKYRYTLKGDDVWFEEKFKKDNEKYVIESKSRQLSLDESNNIIIRITEELNPKN